MTEKTYVKVGDYLIANVMDDKNKSYEIEKYGLMRREFLENEDRGEMTRQMRLGTLPKHLSEVNQQTQSRVNELVEIMKAQENVTEEMKKADDLLWVKKMNSIIAKAEELAIAEFVTVKRKLKVMEKNSNYPF